MTADLRTLSSYKRAVIIEFETSITARGDINFSTFVIQHIQSNALTSTHLCRGVVDFNSLINSNYFNRRTIIPALLDEYRPLFAGQFYYVTTSLEQQLIVYYCFGIRPDLLALPTNDFVFEGNNDYNCMNHLLGSATVKKQYQIQTSCIHYISS
jgi:hypothetical protein